MKTWFWKKWIQ